MRKTLMTTLMLLGMPLLFSCNYFGYTCSEVADCTGKCMQELKGIEYPNESRLVRVRACVAQCREKASSSGWAQYRAIDLCLGDDYNNSEVLDRCSLLQCD